MTRKSSVLVLLSMTIAAAAAADTNLTVMSFNIRYGSDRGPNSWPKRKETVANAIKEQKPDVVGLQECIGFQAEHLVAALPEYQWIGMGRERNGGGEMTAVLYRKETLSPIETCHYWLSETPEVAGSRSWNTACVRMATYVRFMHRESHEMFHFVNTHLDHRSAEARLGASKLIARRTAARSADLPVIITGDFNARAENSEPWTVFQDAGFKDAWLKAKKRLGPEQTFGGFRSPKKDVVSRIDWILTRGDIRVQRCETSVYNENGRYPSDHYPVVADLTLRE